MFGENTDTKMLTEYSCGDTSISLKRVVPDENCPEEYLDLMNHFSNECSEGGSV